MQSHNSKMYVRDACIELESDGKIKVMIKITAKIQFMREWARAAKKSEQRKAFVLVNEQRRRNYYYFSICSLHKSNKCFGWVRTFKKLPSLIFTVVNPIVNSNNIQNGASTLTKRERERKNSNNEIDITEETTVEEKRLWRAHTGKFQRLSHYTCTKQFKLKW